MEKHINAYGFQWIVFFVTASGFYSASYSLFATNVISPALAYLYWPESKNGNHGFVIDIVTLTASFFGMILFGHAADRWGRKFLYGVELIFVIVGTLSIAQASTGFDNSMKIEGWLFFWRIVLGFGIGAEYPVTAIIAAEWTPTKLRGIMMASVFLHQSLGQLTASAVAYGAATHLNVCDGYPQAKCNLEVAGKAVDKFWRIVIGVGAAPAALAILLRFAIRESARWNLDVRGDVTNLNRSKDQITPRMVNSNGPQLGTEHSNTLPAVTPGRENNREQESHHEGSEGIIGRRDTDGSGLPSRKFKFSELRSYLFQEGAIKQLAGVSLCWFLLDISYYGLGLNSPRIISQLWKSREDLPPAKLKDWMTDLVDPRNATIFQVLQRNSARNMITISTGTVPGSFAIIALINYVPRARFMALIFGILALVFLVTGCTLFAARVYEAEHHTLNIFMYAFIQFLFNLGPNTLTWILPAEVFPTKYRGTLYGLAAASGKLGAILIQGIIKAAKLGKPQEAPWKFATLLFCFTGIMLIGAFVAEYMVPEVQILPGHVIEKRTKRFVPRKTRKYKLFGRYQNLVLETIVKELDERKVDETQTERATIEVDE